jgi:hypothetical protein
MKKLGFQAFAFKWVNVCRYVEELRCRLQAIQWRDMAGLCTS